MASHQPPQPLLQQVQPGAPPQGHPGRPAPLRAWTSDIDQFMHSEPERWVCIYPAYLNSRKSKAEGRLLPKSKCVPDPIYRELRDVLIQAGLNPILENKLYPRERSLELNYRGRIRVQIKKEDGSVLNDKFPTRRSVMMHLGEKIPTLKSRTAKGAEGGPQAQIEAQPQQQQQQQQQKKKKKGKK